MMRSVPVIVAWAFFAANAGSAAAPALLGLQRTQGETLAEKRVTELPPGPLYWRLETFPTIEAAQLAGGSYSLVARTSGNVWLVTLGRAVAGSSMGKAIAQVGPLPVPRAAEYVLRVTEGRLAPGGVSAAHTHPGCEAWYLLGGEQTIRTPKGRLRVTAGHWAVGPPAGTPIELTNTGAIERDALALFVLDAAKPDRADATFR